MPPRASVRDVVHSRVCGGPDTYCGHPYQDGMFDFGGGEIAVLHKHAPCDYSSLESIGHAESHSRAKIVMQRSLDGGRTWSDEVILRDDAPSSDLGYPVATELKDGRIFTAYYFNDEPGGEFGGPRYIAGTHFRLA